MKLKPLAPALLALSTACATIPSGGTMAAPLIGKEWTVVEVSGSATLPNARPTLLFSSDGRLAGSIGCNRLIGSYTFSSGNRVSVAPAGTTLMACPPSVMQQEGKFLDLIRGATFYRVESSGELVLTSRSGATTRAR